MDKLVVILVPGADAKGGITNYYQSLRKHLPSNVKYITRGARKWPAKKGKALVFFRLLYDYFNLVRTIVFNDVGIVQTTTAFYLDSIIRDGIFLFISQFFGIKTIVFFRGWDDNFAQNISGFPRFLFKHTFLNADAIIDLAQPNIDCIHNMGYKGLTYLETTLVDEKLVDKINMPTLIDKRVQSVKKRLLFLSRIEKEKGIFHLLRAYELLKATNPDIQLTFAGDGSALDLLKKEVADKEIKDVEFTGFVSGKVKENHFKNAYLFIFLSEFEGMPNAVLEAMAFGLPVITTDVGGISSVFKHNINGKLISNREAENVAKIIDQVLSNEQLYIRCSKANYELAKSKFWSGIVADRMKKIIETINTGRKKCAE